MTAPFEKFSEATVEEVVQDPHKFGAPTFEEFCSNPDQWRGKSQQWFAAIDKGSTILGRHVKKQFYRLNGYRFETLEAVEIAARNMGLNPWKLVPKPQIRDLGGGWCELEVILVDPEAQPRKEILSHAKT